MLGAGLQFGSNRGEDRFYNPAKARRSHQNQQGQNNLRRAKNDVTGHSQSHFTKEKSVVLPVYREQESRDGREGPSKQVNAAARPSCNLERFLESVTPTVPAQYPSKTTMRGWRTCDMESQTYFVLGDLWESFREWSAYGAGVPLDLHDIHGVVQYYVPYLSAIQIYCDPSKWAVKSRNRQLNEDSNSDYFRDSSSDSSSDSDHERCLNYTREQGNHHHLNGHIPSQMDRLSLGDPCSTLQEGFSSDEGESGSDRGCLLFEYLEWIQPYHREPLADKISDLALRCPELKTLRSCDLLPSSWISVAWYPIYRIPMGPTLKDPDACFLTFHSLHTPAAGSKTARSPAVAYPKDMDDVPRISLPVFGLASYKFKASWWIPNGGSERQLAISLLQAAINWLTLLKVKHPDFLFFCRR